MKDPARKYSPKRPDPQMARRALLLPKRYSEQHKENFYKKLQKGEISEEFKQERVWRPGGAAVKVKTQQEADVALIQSSAAMKRSVSQQKMKKVKKSQRRRSAGAHRSTQRVRARKQTIDGVQQARSGFQALRRLDSRGNEGEGRSGRGNSGGHRPDSLFERSRVVESGHRASRSPHN